MKPFVVKTMTLLLFVFFITQMFTGLSLRFGWKPEAIEQIHSISGMIFILLVFFHWYLFGRFFIHMFRKRDV